MSKENESIQKVGPYMLKKVKPGLTSAGIAPTYAVCTPDRWGMRYSDLDPKRPGQLMYPIARDYARAMQSLLINRIQWEKIYLGKPNETPELRLEWPIDKNQQDKFLSLLKPIMMSSLTNKSGGFGIPNEAFPDLISYTPKNPLEQGAFAAELWQMFINFNYFRKIFNFTKVEPYGSAQYVSDVEPLRELADTLYHESRHCQQNFWMIALIAQHPDNFSEIPNIKKWFPAMAKLRASITSLPEQVIELATQQSIPDDTAALISLKRMAVGNYFYDLDLWRRNNFRPSYIADSAEMDAELQRVRSVAAELLQHVGIGGTAIDVDTMLGEEPVCIWGYQQRPWENDAFVCGDMASAYWREGFGIGLKTYPADQCSRDYENRYDLGKRLESRKTAGSSGAN